EDLQILLVCELPVGDGYFSLNALEQGLFLRSFRVPQFLIDARVDQGVDTADKEAGHASDLADISAAGGQLLKAHDISFGDPLINLLREQQRDVDIDALADQLLKRGNTFRSARHLDHDIRPAYRIPQAARFLQRAWRVVRQIRRDLQADVSIPPLSLVVNRAQHVSSILDVADGQQFIAGLRIQVSPRVQRSQKVRVVGTACNGFFEDRGIRGHAAQPIFFDKALQFAAGEQLPADVVQPYRLSILQELFQRIDSFGSFKNSGRLHTIFSSKMLARFVCVPLCALW